LAPKALDDVGGQLANLTLGQAIPVCGVERFMDNGVHATARRTMDGVDVDDVGIFLHLLGVP
jgi:hypothetical protein